MNRILLVFVMLFSFSVSSYGQKKGPDCGPGEKFCSGDCYPAADCRQGGPPPPGLVVPIDANIHLLLAAGLGFGIYLIGFQKKFSSSLRNSENKK